MLFYGVGERMTRRLAAIVIGSQSVAVGLGGLVAWSLSGTAGGSRHTAYLVVGCVLMVLCVVAAGTLRRPWGVTLGWLIEAATIASVVVLPAMLVVGLVFGAMWIVALVQGPKLDAMTRDFVANQDKQDHSDPDPRSAG